MLNSSASSDGAWASTRLNSAPWRLRAGSFVVCAALLSMRAWDRLIHSQLWAEDGQVFVSEAFRFGFPSLWRPYAGYLHVVPRAVALVATRVDLHALPVLVCVTALLMGAWSFSQIADERCANIVADERLRVLVAVALCFSPGTHEVLGNLANVHALGMLWLGVLAARQPGTPLRNYERLVLPAVAFTAAEALVLLPAFAVRSVAPSCRRARPDERWSAVILAIAACVHLALSHSLPGNDFTPAVGRWAALMHAEVSGLLLGPLLGPTGLAMVWNASSALALASAALAALGLTAAAWRSRSSTTWPVALSVICWAVLPALTVLVRPGAELAYGVRPHAGYTWARYAFQLAPAGLVAWVALLARWPLRRSPWLASLVLLVGIALAPPRWKIRAWDAPRWDTALQSARADPLDGCEKQARSSEVRVATAPRGWFVELPRDRVCAGR